MIKPEIRDRVLKLKQAGKSIRWIARHQKISRHNVRKILRGVPTEEKTQEKRPSLLDPFRRRIKDLVEEGLTAALIFRRIRPQGYAGGRTILDDHVRSLRGSRHEKRAFIRFETLPAEESQQDWSPYQVDIDGKPTVIQVFSLILCWSRFQLFRAFRDQQFSSLVYGFVAAFRYFLGVPWKVVTDNQKTITPFWIEEKAVITDKFLEFSKHYGFEIQICRPGDKERKGKVERPFDYFEKAFLPGRIFHSFEDLNDQIQRWLDAVDFPEEGNHRVHGTTREVPYERWLEEKAYLYELPATDHLPRQVEVRLVGIDSTISVLGVRYTVPVDFAQKKVWVSIGEGDLLVYSEKGEVVARHQLSTRKGGVVINEEHYAKLRARQRRPLSLPQIEREFLGRFPSGRRFLDDLKKTVRSIAPIHIREILALARRYPAGDVERALQRAVSDGTATSGYVRQILEISHPKGLLSDTAREPPKGLTLGPIDCGSPEGYDGIFDTDGDDKKEERSNDDDQNHDPRS
jgi:transposase